MQHFVELVVRPLIIAEIFLQMRGETAFVHVHRQPRARTENDIPREAAHLP